MSFIGQVTNINQTMYVPAHIVAEHLASIKFANDFAKIQAKEKEEKVREIREVEETHEIDDNLIKDEQRENAKQSIIRHIDLKG
jgi:hypothetical protein